MADELRRAMARTIAERAERGEYGRLTYETLGKMLADWLGDPVPYTAEAVRTWVTTGRDPGFAVSVALLAILSPDADLHALARSTYLRRTPRGGTKRKRRGGFAHRPERAKRPGDRGGKGEKGKGAA